MLGASALLVLSSCAGPDEVPRADDGPVPTEGFVGRAGELAPYVLEPAVELVPVPESRDGQPEQQPVRPQAPGPARQQRAAGVPTRLLVPSLGVDAPVVGIGVTDGVLIPPGDPQTLGWWRDGAAPGAAHGGALIAGHTVHTGGGVFDDLETLRPGDRVTVRTANGRIRYAVSGVAIYRKAGLARDAARVFRQSGPGRLVLITCEDWNGAGYDSNAVVFAEPG